MTTIEVDFIPADRNTGIGSIEPASIQIAHADWSIEQGAESASISLPTFVSTADSVTSVVSAIEDEDTAFLEASRQRLVRQLRSNS